MALAPRIGLTALRNWLALRDPKKIASTLRRCNLFGMPFSRTLFSSLADRQALTAEHVREALQNGTLSAEGDRAKTILTDFVHGITRNSRVDLLQVVWEVYKEHLLLEREGRLCIHDRSCPVQCIQWCIEKATETGGLNLLERGDSEGDTILHYLARRGCLALLKLLWGRREDRTAGSRRIGDIFFIRNHEGRLLTHIAADNGKHEILEYFFDEGCLHMLVDTADAKGIAPIDSKDVAGWMDPSTAYPDHGTVCDEIVLAFLQRIYVLRDRRASAVLLPSVVRLAVRHEHVSVLEWLCQIDLSEFGKLFVPLLSPLKDTLDGVPVPRTQWESNLPQRVLEWHDLVGALGRILSADTVAERAAATSAAERILRIGDPICGATRYPFIQRRALMEGLHDLSSNEAAFSASFPALALTGERKLINGDYQTATSKSDKNISSSI